VYFQLHESKRQQNQSRFFCRKTNCHGFDYELSESSVTRTDCIRDLGVLIDTKLHFHQQVDNIFSQAINLLGLIQTVTLFFSSLHSSFCLYSALQSDSSWNMSLLHGILTLFQMLVGWSTSSVSLHLFVIVVFSVT
jgi:hypothetical protein